MESCITAMPNCMTRSIRVVRKIFEHQLGHNVAANKLKNICFYALCLHGQLRAEKTTLLSECVAIKVNLQV